jgi:hypothetical protein
MLHENDCSQRLNRLRKNVLYEGHGFSRATELWPLTASTAEVRFSTLVLHGNYGENRTSAAKAVPARYIYGTAEPVPFVNMTFPQPAREAHVACSTRPSAETKPARSQKPVPDRRMARL